MASPMTVHGRVSKMDTIPQGKHHPRPERKDSKWEILTNLEPGTQYNIRPKKMEGLLTKKRKWPMKGWHKRYFVLDNGYLSYGKSAHELCRRGRTLGRIDVGCAVISAKPELFRIDIDDESFIHHLKVSDLESFGLWFEQLQQHRFYRQHQIQETEKVQSPSPQHGGSLPRGGKSMMPSTGPKAMILQEFHAMDDRMTNQMLAIQQQAVNLGLLAQKLEDDQGALPSASKQKNFFGLRKKKSGNGTLAGSGAGPSSTSNSRSSTLTGGAETQQRSQSPSLIDLDIPENDLAALSSSLSNSNPSLNSRPSSMNLSAQTKEELINLVQDLQAEMASLVRTYTGDKEKLKTAIINLSEADHQFKTSTLGSGSTPAGNMQQIVSLRQTLNQVIQQNTQLRGKLQRIHAESQLDDMPAIPTLGMTDTLIRGLGHQSLSYSSSCISEFFDAREYNTDDGARSEYSSDDDFCSEENEDDASTDDDFEEAEMQASSLSTEYASLEASSQDASNVEAEPKEVGAAVVASLTSTLTRMTGRRQKLPAVMPDTSGLNLWNLLCKNIGKDLSKISMPVTLNEPLSALQRLCEELEYSELLDKAVESADAVDRMTLVAAFAVSAYGYCTARAGHKPFNPLLGETYECIRDDKGFKYLAEQVSHHPPVSACHAIGKNWVWWQDLRVKTKFWGKSMEFQPEGIVHLKLILPDGTEEVYTWNKITTCIHNLFSSGSDRWADLYGECHVKCKVNNQETLLCKLEFMKASGYWTSGKKHEVVGTINSPKKGGSKVLQHLFGICTEALYCGQAPSARCIWRPGALPNDCELFYGFSRFAIELNEILESERLHLPKTDTRFRPDQRALEEGQISEAETLKLKLEQVQRERRMEMEQSSSAHDPQWFTKVSDTQWTFNSKYWTMRNECTFDEQNLLDLW